MKNIISKSGMPVKPGMLLFIIVFFIPGCKTNTGGQVLIKKIKAAPVKAENKGVSSEYENRNIFMDKPSPPPALNGDLRFQSLD